MTDAPDAEIRLPVPPRVDLRVDLYGVSRDLQAIKDELARRPVRWEIIRLALGCLAVVVIALLLIR
jgi:hypothetical protein